MHSLHMYLPILALFSLLLPFSSSGFTSGLSQSQVKMTSAAQTADISPALSMDSVTDNVIRRSSRVPNPTNKGLEYQIHQKLKAFDTAIRIWKWYAIKVEKPLLESNDLHVLQHECQAITDLIDKCVFKFNSPSGSL